jgi:DNA helicase-2/ATP-dependent DNA helicase PcrA
VIDFLKDLNEAQREAVQYVNGPSLVIAGAGSGKTRVLTYRIAYLLSQGINPHSILALTFTNKAAKEMKERISKLVGHNLARNLWMGTFHSIFSKILRIESGSLGYSSFYTIYDTADSKSVIRSLLKELNIDDRVYKVNEVMGRISMAKNNLVSPQSYIANNTLIEQDRTAHKPRMADIYRLYCIRCKKADAMDFDDLLLNTNILFRDFPEILEKYKHLFNYILVDEYQDTNFSQYLIVNKLASSHKNVCVVGDDAQSIYSFRGAKIENILNFRNDYPEYKLFKLEQNYRSTQTIVNAANSIIAKNKSQINKNVWSAKEAGNLIKVFEAQTDQEEGFIVANNILDNRLTNQLNYSQYAILYRTNAQSRIFEESLRKRNIPYKIYGSLSFYQRKEIKDILAYFRLVINKNDDEALKRIINYPARGIGIVTIEKLEFLASSIEKSMWTVTDEPSIHTAGLNKGAIQKIENFREMINSFTQKLYTHDAYDLAMYIARASGIFDDLKAENTFESISRFENMQELFNSIKEFVDTNKTETNTLITLDHYMENVSLLTDTDTEKDEDRDKVSLMTIHSAKGLEFDYVHIVGVEEDLFPSKMSLGNPHELEEERRLFYVALTRAATQAYISYAKNRYKWGVPALCTPSRFVKDIDKQYLELPNSFEETAKADVYDDFEVNSFKPYRKEVVSNRGTRSSNSIKPTTFNKRLVDIKTASHQKIIISETFKADDPALIKAGMEVVHQQFGTGKVVNIEGVSPNNKATVMFQSAGEKKLLLKFARLKIVT